MRDVYRIRPRRHEALGAKPPDDIDSIRAAHLDQFAAEGGLSRGREKRRSQRRD